MKIIAERDILKGNQTLRITFLGSALVMDFYLPILTLNEGFFFPF